MIILSERVDVLVDCLFGRIVIGRESILGRKLYEQPERGTLKFKSKERDSITLNERTTLYGTKLMRRHIINAAQHPVLLDGRQVAAVNARLELDLRIGAAFTRFQTMKLQRAIDVLSTENRIISYGAPKIWTLVD